MTPYQIQVLLINPNYFSVNVNFLLHHDLKVWFLWENLLKCEKFEFKLEIWEIKKSIFLKIKIEFQFLLYKKSRFLKRISKMPWPSNLFYTKTPIFIQFPKLNKSSLPLGSIYFSLFGDHLFCSRILDFSFSQFDRILRRLILVMISCSSSEVWQQHFYVFPII